MFRPTRLLLIHLVVCVHVYTTIIIYAFPRTRRVTSNYVSKYRSFFLSASDQGVDYSSDRVLTIVICQLTINEIRSVKLD